MYDVFITACSVPKVVTLHEHPWFRDDRDSGEYSTLADRVFAGLAGHGGRTGEEILGSVMQRHAGIHVHHAWQKERLVGRAVPAERVLVKAMPVPTCRTNRDDTSRFMSRFNLDGKRLLTVTGFMFERKQYERAIDILPSLPADVILCALGGRARPSYLIDLRDRARSMGVEDRFLVTGYLEADLLHAGLAATAVFLAPYADVSSSASVARNVGSGAPIVAADNASFTDMASSGAGILTVNTGCPDEFGATVKQILDDEALAGSLRERNKEYCRRHSFESFTEGLMEWYASCLRTKGSGCVG